MKGCEAKVLLVEDDQDLASVLRLVLEEQGFQCVVAGTVAEGSDQIRHEHFRFLLLDLILPDGSGTDIIPLLDQTSNCDASVIVSSGNVGPQTESNPRVSRVFQKPYSMDELLDFMKRNNER